MTILEFCRESLEFGLPLKGFPIKSLLKHLALEPKFESRVKLFDLLFIRKPFRELLNL